MAQEQNQPQQQGQQVQVKVTDEALKGSYANMVQIGHTAEEFILDFMNLFPPQGQLVSRVIVSPAHMKRIVTALEQNLKQYESQFGVIQAGQGPATHNIGFRTENN